MNKSLLDIISIAALSSAWLIVSGVIWKLSERIEKASSEEAKIQAYLWIADFSPQNQLNKWARTFSQALDTIFG
jgi:hypothetical protein